MNPAIQGWGTALPEHAIEQADAAALAIELTLNADSRLRTLPALYRRTGVRRRYSVLFHANGSKPVQTFYLPMPPSATSAYGPSTRERMQAYSDFALPLAAKAAKSALAFGSPAFRRNLIPAQAGTPELNSIPAEAGTPELSISHLITVSCSGFSAPGIDITLINELGLAPSVERTHIGFMGCHGALNGLRVARAICNADPNARVLMCALELCSLHYQFSADSDKIVSNALFADGAAAVVIGSNGDAGGWQITSTGSCLIPESLDAMTWRIGDNGFEMTLSPRVPELITSHLRPWLETWLRSNKLCIEDVASWAVHPGGPRILTAVEQALALDANALEVSRHVLAECGNMSSPTILFILERLAKAGAPRPAVALGFGPGLIAEAVLFR